MGYLSLFIHNYNKNITVIKAYIEFFVYLILKICLPKYQPTKKSILFINTGEIGDLLVCSQLLENDYLFEDYEYIGLVIKSKYLELLKYNNTKINIIEIKINKFKYSIYYKYKMLSFLRKLSFTTVINLNAARGIINEELTHSLNSKNTICLNNDFTYLGRKLGHYFSGKYSKIIFENEFNEYKKIDLLMKYFTKGKIKVKNTSKIFYYNFEEINKYISEWRKYIIIAPKSSIGNRDWNIENFKYIASKLSSKYKIIILGSNSQKNILEKSFSNSKNILVYAGKFHLYHLPQIIKYAQLFIGLDSGLTHIAIKVRTKLIAIIGGGEFGRFFPYKESNKTFFLYNKLDCFNCQWKCHLEKQFCISEVKPETVLNFANYLLTS